MYDPKEAIAVYRGWEAYEQTQPKGIQGEVIDFDLVPEITDSVDFHSRDEILARLLALRDKVAVADEISEFILAKLNAGIYYLRILISGDLPEFYEHTRNMLGKTPELVSNGQVEEQKQVVLRLLAEHGVVWPNGRVDFRQFNEFNDSIRVFEEDAENEAREKEEILLPLVKELLGFADLDVPHRIELVREDAYWGGWARGKKGDLLLQYNFHPNQHWHKGDMEYLTLHEVCGHFVHAAALARGIEEGRLDPFIGIATVQDPHGFMGEGIADALTYFFPDDLPLSPLAILSREQRNWRDFLNNNAHVLINMGQAEDVLLGYLLQNPFSTAERARLNLRTWVSDPLLRSYQYAYGIALKYHRVFAERMTRQQKIKYLRYAFTRYVTPRRLIEEANKIIEQA